MAESARAVAPWHSANDAYIVSAEPNNVCSSRTRIGLLCLSAIPDDPRVRRQGDLFHTSGYTVVGIGLPGYRSTKPDWLYRDGTPPVGEASPKPAEASAREADPLPVELSVASRDAAARGGTLPRILEVWRGLGHPLERELKWLWRRYHAARARGRRAFDLLLVHVLASHALKLYWGLSDRFEMLYRLARKEKADLWLANDWTTLPIAMRLSQEQGVPFLYDTHELAVDEYAQSLKWRLLHRHVIAAIEGTVIRAAAGVTCVSDGIADRLQEVHKLPERPRVVRNTPRYSEAPFRPTGERIEVLYHGIVAPGRALEETIRSVPHWRPEFALTIRGPSDAAYLAGLRKLAAEGGVERRITFAPPVPMTALVAEATRFDVGLFAIRDDSLQNRYVLPNKFFEYTMAGLALCVSDLPEMRRLIEQHQMGVLIDRVEPEVIARAINGLDRYGIDACKQRALAAAKVLCWETEGETFLELAEGAIEKKSAADSA